MTLCGDKCLSTIQEHVHVAASLRCHCWSCEDCAPQRRKELQAQACAGNPTKFLTLTSRRRPGITPEGAARELVRAWRIIRRRHHKLKPHDKIEFIAFFEATKLGWPHLHILLRCNWISQKWVSKLMRKLTNSPVVYICEINSKKKAASYVTKYTTKGLGQFGTLKRYWKSKKYENETRKKQKGKYKWAIEEMTLDQWSRMWASQGYEVQQVSKWKATASKKHAGLFCSDAYGVGPPNASLA